jgi:hypothetical protein
MSSSSQLSSSKSLDTSGVCLACEANGWCESLTIIERSQSRYVYQRERTPVA